MDKWQAELTRQVRLSDKNWSVALALSVFLGFLGVDRFYLNSVALGLLKMLTLGGLAYWWLIDIALLLLGRMKDADGGLVAPPYADK